MRNSFAGQINKTTVKAFLQRISILSLLLVPTIGYYLYDGNTVWHQALLFVLIRGIALFATIELFEMAQKRWFKIFVLVLFFPAYFADVLFLYGYKSLMSTSSSMALFSSTYGESFDFITLYGWVIAGIILMYLAVGVFFVRYRVQFVKLKSRLVQGVVLLGVIVLSLVAENIYSVAIDGIGRGYFSFFKEKVIKHFPVNMYYRTYEYLLYRKKVEEHQKNVANYRFNAVDENKNEPLTVVLVIGETQRADMYMQIVNEHLSMLPSFNTDNLVLFPNAFSTSNSTAYCFPLIVTRASADQFHIKNVEPSVVSLFKEAGFKTYWLANQNLFKGPETKGYKTAVDEFYPLWKKGQGDMVISQQLDEILHQSAQKKFIIVNLKGNHYKYEYPDEYNIYKPNLDTENISVIDAEYKQLFINSYHNNSLFELNVMDHIHSSLDSLNQKATLLFASDHGESFWELPHEIFGHGSSFVPVEQLSTFAYVWMSDEYRKENAEMHNNIQLNASKLFSSDHIFYTIAEMAKVSFKDQNPNYSICNRQFIDQDTLKVLIGEKVLHFDKKQLNYTEGN